MLPRTTLADLVTTEDIPSLLFDLADIQQLAGVALLWQSMAQSPFGPMWHGTLALGNELLLRPPGLPLALAIGPSSDAPATARMLLTNEWFVEVERLALALRFDPRLLRPLDPTSPHAEIRVESGLYITRDTVEFTNPSARLSLPPCEIPGTGIVVSLDDVQIDLAEDRSPPEVVELGYDESFRGIYAESASLRFLPRLRFGGQFGLALTANAIAISADGVTCDLLLNAQLDTRDGQIGPASERVGELLSPSWPLAIGWAEAQIFNSVPLRFRAAGVVRVPLLDVLCTLDFVMERRTAGDGYAYAAEIACGEASRIATPFGNIGFANLALRGTLDGDTLTLAGTIADLRVDLAPLQLRVGASSLLFAHTEARDELRLQLSDVPLGPLGVVDLAEMLVVEERTPAGTTRFVSLQTTLRWGDLRPRLALPGFFPAPPDAEYVTARLAWRDDEASGERVLELRLSAAVRNVDRLWSFVPAAFRPEVPRATLTLDLVYRSSDEFAGAATTGGLAGALSIDLELRLPQGSDRALFGLLHVQTGNANGIIRARLRASVDAQGQPALSMALSDLVSVDVSLPGLPQPEPPIHIELLSVDFRLQSGAVASGELAVRGAFALRPIAPPQAVPIAAHLQQLLSPIQPGTLVGEAELRLQFNGDQTQLDIMCKFGQARVRIDVFDMVAALTRGFSPPSRVTPPSNALDLDIVVGFALQHLTLRLGSLDEAAPATSIEFGLAVTLAGITAEGYVRLSERELAIGLRELRVPLRMPRIPVSAHELAALDTDAQWQAAIDEVAREITSLEGQPDSRQRVVELQVRRFVLEEMLRIRRLLKGGTSVQVYQEALVAVFNVLDVTTGIVRIDSDVYLALENVQFVIPFADPRAIRIEGHTHLEGFAPDDPFRGLNGVELGLGLSSDRIFFSVASLGEPIPLPSFGRYPGGTASLHELTIGYGYTKNSLSITFAGAVKLPPQLIADADTSRTIGAGVRLPSHTSLGFKLDLVPVPGPIPIVPLFEFALDMHSPNAPALVRTDRCEPYWDGLQFVVPGLFRADIKQIGVAPMLGLLPISNARFDGDVMLGGEKNGVTVIADNMLFLAGLNSAPPAPIPLFASPFEPYFDNLCVGIRLAGFGLNINVQRPFPSFSLLTLLEVLGLLADPDMRIDPNGHLANTLRVAISDFTLVLPREVLRIFPQAEALAVRDQGLTINLGTFIGALQHARTVLVEILDVLADGARGLPERIERLAAQALNLRPGALLAALPPELRRLELNASFAGFEAHATLLLLDASDHARLVEEFALRSAPAPTTSRPQLAIGQPSDPAALATFRPTLPDVPNTPRTYYPDEPGTSLFRGEAFNSFEATDLDAIPPGSAAGVVVGAYVRVFGAQRYRFLGFLFEDGSFGMVTRVDIEPLKLSIAGISVELPLRVSGRLALLGKGWGEGMGGSIQAQVMVENLQIIPGVRVDIGLMQPASILLSSNGAIDLRGDARVSFFGGLATLEGRAEVSNTHLFVFGQCNLRVGPLALHVEGRAQIGPNDRFELANSGTLTIAGLQVLDVDASISDKRAELVCKLDTGVWKTPVGDLTCHLNMQLRGMIDVSQITRPLFALEGSTSLTLFGATINGQGGMGLDENGIYTYVAGQLLWREREWLSGRLELSSKGSVKIQGRTSCALHLTPTKLPAGIELAGLYLKIDLDGWLMLDLGGGLAGFGLKVDWMLGITLPGTEMKNQIFPLAMQKHTFGGVGAISELLFGIDGFKLLPFDKISIPIPRVRAATEGQIEIGTGWTRTFPAIPVPYVHLQDGREWPDVQETDGEGNPNKHHFTTIPTQFSVDVSSPNVPRLEIPLPNLEFGKPFWIQLASRMSKPSKEEPESAELGIKIAVFGDERFISLWEFV